MKTPLFVGRDLGLARVPLFLATAAWIATIPNASTVRQFFESPSAGHGLGAIVFAFGGWLFIATVTLGFLLLAGLLFPGRMAKLLAIVALVAASALGYFSTFYGTQFDRTMLLNMVQTNAVESIELLHPRLFAWIVVVGVLPAAVVWRMPYRPSGFRRTTAIALGIVTVMLLTTLALVYAQYPRYAAATRNRNVTFDTVAPANVVVAALRLAAAEYSAGKVRAPRGVDARQAYPIARPRLLVFVLGETARAANHGLNGYLRETTPRMRAAKGYYFADTEACGTATTISVPCIFSGLARHEFSLLSSRDNETLVDVVVRAGARVLWLDNDSGCKDVCAKADFRDLTGSKDPRWCPEPAECFDEMLLDGLESQVRTESRDTLVVLHIKGSHGPAYYKRYPPEFEKFTPVCRSSDLASCDAESLRNAYDNSILYTDHFVGETIRMLEKVSDQFATALLYVSDHGESLGESGLYLHGMPYAIAPAEQTRVPMYAWVSPQFLAMERWDVACMARQTRLTRSHDNVYPTVLGFMEIESVEYKPALDVFEACDPPGPSVTARKPVPNASQPGPILGR